MVTVKKNKFDSLQEMWKTLNNEYENFVTGHI